MNDWTLILVTGSAGCKERHDNFRNMTYFSAFRSDDYGYTRMQVFNSSHLYLEQVSDDQVLKFILLELIVIKRLK